MKKSIPLFLAALLPTIGQSSAQTHSIFLSDSNSNGELDQGFPDLYRAQPAFITSFLATYNENTQLLNLDVEFDRNTDNPDGFWLVINDGPNPSLVQNEHAIFYFDAGATGSANVTAYSYNGDQSFDSYVNPGQLLSSSLTSSELNGEATYLGDTSIFSLTADVSIINDAANFPQFGLDEDWKGAKFGENAGIWFHPVTYEDGPQPTYNSDGGLESFPITSTAFSGWIDIGNAPTVPEPSSILLAFTTLAFFSTRRKR